MAKKESAAQAPAKKKKAVEEARPFTEAARLRVKYNEGSSSPAEGEVRLYQRDADTQAGEDRSQHGFGFR